MIVQCQTKCEKRTPLTQNIAFPQAVRVIKPIIETPAPSRIQTQTTLKETVLSWVRERVQA